MHYPSTPAWHILTGEFPPTGGGVSDYCHLLAQGLTTRGQKVHVWSPSLSSGPVPTQPMSLQSMEVHRVTNGWGAADLTILDRHISAFKEPRRILLQYVPHAFGPRGINLSLGPWLARRQLSGDEVWLMVHEPHYPFRWTDPPKHWLLSALQRWMLRSALRASDRVFVATEAWFRYLWRVGGPRAGVSVMTLPIPSNISPVKDPASVAQRRADLKIATRYLIGTFGTYHTLIANPLAKIITKIGDARSDCSFLFLGRGAQKFAAQLAAERPALRMKLFARDGLGERETSFFLQACDVMVQPYSDGVTTRRTSIMASLAHGIPTATNQGFLSEDIWSKTRCVALTATWADLPQAVEHLLDHKDERASLGRLGKEIYDSQFAMEHTITSLLNAI